MSQNWLIVCDKKIQNSTSGVQAGTALDPQVTKMDATKSVN